MSPLVDRSQLQPRIAEYAVGTMQALADTTPLMQAREYRAGARSRLRAFTREMMAKLADDRFHVSRKVDGEFNLLVVDGDEAFLVNPGGTVRMGLPLLAEARALLAKAGVRRGTFAGEFYCQRPDGRRPRVHDISRIARRPESAAEIATLGFAVFDIVDLPGIEPAEPFAAKWDRITALFGAGKLAHPVESQWVDKVDQVKEIFAQWVEKGGAEGIVVRGERSGSYKVKLQHTLDVCVVGFAEGTEDREGMLHDLLIAVMRADGSFHILGRVGGGFSDDQRRKFLLELEDMRVESEYHESSADRVAYRMVRPEWVIEISCLDLLTENSSGAPRPAMVLDWDAAASTWRTIRRMPLASIISPQFLRRRDDKQVTKGDLRLEQLTDIVEIPDATVAAREVAMPASQVLRRKVATKVLKGNELVRKLMLWKTNKEHVSPDHPAYVLYVTDFSPGRKTPLEREIRVSNDLDQIEEMWTALDAEYFVRGWKEA